MNKLQQKINDISENDLKVILTKCKTYGEVCSHFNVRSNKVHYNLIKQLANKFDIKFKEINKTKVYCLNCGKEILGYYRHSKKFCSRSCSASYNNKLRSKNNERFCLNCGNILKPHSKKFCSNKCQGEYQQKEKIDKWLKDGNISTDGQLPTYIRKYLHNKYNSKCQICGWGEINKTTGLVPLQIHHIDGDCTNNNIKNLQLLCPNCHSLTENFGSTNKNCKRMFYRISKCSN